MGRPVRKSAFEEKKIEVERKQKKNEQRPAPAGDEPEVFCDMLKTKYPIEQRTLLISSIVEPMIHDRIGYDEAQIKALADNMHEIGQLQPIVVRELEDGTLERISGFRRILAAKKLGWKEIRADVLIGVSDRDAALIMLSENIMREDTNIYDQTKKILQYIELAFELGEGKAVSLLNRFKNYDAGLIKSLTSHEAQIRGEVDSLLNRTLNIDLNGMVGRLRVLSLDERLVNEIKKNRITYSHALAISKGVKKGLDIDKLIAYTVKHGPSYNALNAYIKSLIESREGKQGAGRVEKLVGIGKMISTRRLKKLDDETLAKVEALAEEIRELME